MKRKMMSPRPAIAVLTLVSGIGAAHAAEFDVGNPDLAVRWDNTVRYNYMNRVQKQNQNLLNSANSDDGDRNFNRGTVSSRIDLISELDVVFRNDYGVRVSGAAWYDAAYRRLDNTNVATSNHLENGVQALGLSDATQRFHKGPSGEILDGFVFGRFNLGEMPINVKLGRHTAFWGEAFLSPIHSLSYGQSPLDIRKAASVPGTEAKELFLPRSALSAQLQATPDLSIAGQYFLEWKPFRIPEAGSFLGAADMLQQGGEALILGPGAFLRRGDDVTPKNSGNWGLSARWKPDWLDGTAGFYYRETADIMPQVHVAPIAGKYYLVYPDDIKIFGISLAKNVAGTSIGADLNYRKNMPLNSEGVVILPAALAAHTPGAITALPSAGETGGARGNTWHGVLNMLGSFGRTPLFDSASLLAELQWNHWTNVTQGAAVFKGRDGYTGIDKVSKNFVGLGLSFTPSWYQVFPGVDLLMPLFYTRGLSGNAAVSGGGDKSAGSFSIGLGADAYQKYRFDLSYVGSYGPYRTDATGAVSSAAQAAMTKDRGFVSLTFKTTY